MHPVFYVEGCNFNVKVILLECTLWLVLTQIVRVSKQAEQKCNKAAACLAWKSSRGTLREPKLFTE